MQVGFRFLKAFQLIEHHAKVGVGYCVVWALLYGDAVCIDGFRIPPLPIQGIA